MGLGESVVNRKGVVPLLFVSALTGLAAMGSAQTFTLTDTGTSATIVANSTFGLKDWTLLGVDQVFANTYMWRIGDSSTADFIQNLPVTNAVQTGNRFLDLTYTNVAQGFAIDITYVLTGGINTFDVAEIVRVRNTGASALDFRLFQYNDFDLNNTAGDDTVSRVNSSQIKQVDGLVALNVLNQGATPQPNFSELGSTSFGSSIISTSGYNLDTTPGNNIGQSFSGDAAYAFQWSVNIGAGQSYTISTDKVAAVPEPATMAALGLGALTLLRRRKRNA